MKNKNFPLKGKIINTNNSEFNIEDIPILNSSITIFSDLPEIDSNIKKMNENIFISKPIKISESHIDFLTRMTLESLFKNLKESDREI